MSPVIFLAIGLVVVVWLVALAIRAAKARQKELREWAFRNGFDYTPGPMPANQIAPIDCFTLAENVTVLDASNIVRGSRGMPVTFFDLKRTTRGTSPGGSIDHDTNLESCAAFSVSGVNFPRFSFIALMSAGAGTLRAKLMETAITMGSKLNPAAMESVVRFEAYPGMLLSGRGSHDAKDAFAELLPFFAERTGWQIEGDGSWLILRCRPDFHAEGFRRGRVVDPRDYDLYVARAGEIAERVRAAFASRER